MYILLDFSAYKVSEELPVDINMEPPSREELGYRSPESYRSPEVEQSSRWT